VTAQITWSYEINKTAYHLPEGCSSLGMRHGKITKAFGLSIDGGIPETLYEFITQMKNTVTADNEIINLKGDEFSYGLVEEWLRNDMLKEAIREVAKKELIND